MGFCNSKTSSNQGNQYQWIDPLGPNASGGYTPSGAPEMRSQVFNYLGNNLPQANAAGSAYAAALNRAAAEPGWSAVADNASKTASGGYLNGSPQLDRAMAWNRAQTLADAANQNARVRSRFAQNGADWSTGNQQAQEADNVAAGAQAQNAAAQTYLQNYLTERANQNNAGAMLQQAQTAPLNYLSQVPGAYTSGLNGVAGLLSGLSSGGQVVNSRSTSSTNDTPSLGSSIMSGISAL